MRNKIQRKFVLGDKWLYYKIYCGPKTVDSILVNEISNILDELFRTGIIDKFFFIRYFDPDSHLRIRFHMNDIENLNTIVQLIKEKLKYYIDKRIVWNISVDAYNREIERYGNTTIEEVETLFYFDSLAIVYFLKEIEDDSTDDIRWYWGIKCMDLMLDNFGFSIVDKEIFYGNLSMNFSKEFNIDKHLRIQLDKKYRSEVGQLEKVLSSNEKDIIIGIKHILWYMKKAKPVIQIILMLLKNEKEDLHVNKILASLMHMHFNRLFNTKQRSHEFVIYYFLHKYYKSEVAKIKYN